MRTIVFEHGKPVGIVEGEYSGPMDFAPTPDGFDENRLAEYHYVAGQARLPDPSLTDRAAMLMLAVSNGYYSAVERPKISVLLNSRDAGGNPRTVVVDGGRQDYFNFKEEWDNTSESDRTVIRDAANVRINNITKTDLQLIYRTIYRYGRTVHAEKWAKEERIKAAVHSDDPESAIAVLEADVDFLRYS